MQTFLNSNFPQYLYFFKNIFWGHLYALIRCNNREITGNLVKRKAELTGVIVVNGWRLNPYVTG